MATAKTYDRTKASNFKPKPYNTFSKSFIRDEDEDEFKRARNNKPAEKPKEKPLGKEETIRRLEREKKVVEKKKKYDVYEGFGKPKHPQFKEKRVKKDLTKSYYNGLFDEEE